MLVFLMYIIILQKMPDDPQFEGQLGVGILPKGHRSGHG